MTNLPPRARAYLDEHPDATPRQMADALNLGLSTAHVYQSWWRLERRAASRPVFLDDAELRRRMAERSAAA
jgi:hypothetical protein